MSTLNLTDARRIALRVVLWQAAATIVVGALFLAFATRHAAMSALLGGAIGVAASLAMFLAAFRKSTEADAKRIVSAFYKGEAAKLLITVLLFAAVLAFVKVGVAPFFCGYIATLVVYWLALIR